MTWTQMKLYARVARQQRMDDYIMQLEIAHNPYRKERDAKQFHSSLQRERARVSRPERKPFHSIAEFEAAYGKVERHKVTREEFERMRPKDLRR